MVKPSKHTDNTAEALPASDSDFVWGAKGIGREINRTEAQVNAMLAAGLLDGAVKKVSHKRWLGSKRLLHRVLLGAE